MMRDPWSVVYAKHASDGFNARLHGVLRDLTRDTLAAVGDPLVAVVVTGSYGEGNGRCVAVIGGRGSGVWSQGQAPADRLEIMVVANAKSQTVRKLLVPVSQKYAAILKVEVQFIMIINEKDLRQVRPSLAWYERVQNHRVMFGGETVFDGLRERFGLQSDACSTPDFGQDEALWMLTFGAFQTLRCLCDRTGENRGIFFSLVRHLGDVLLLHAGTWEPDQLERDHLVLHLLADNQWFRAHADAAFSIHELYREAIVCRGNVDRTDCTIVWGDYITAWNLIAGYVSHTASAAQGKNKTKGWWYRLIQPVMHGMSRHGERRALGLGQRLFVVWGEWYYRRH